MKAQETETVTVAEELDYLNHFNVDHPGHYISNSGLEVIDVIKAFTENLEGEEAFCIGNAIKYICRWSKKNGVEDLEKAKWYIDRVIERRSK